MNSRERVTAALNHREPDRIPIDFNGHRSSGIMVPAYQKLREHMGLKPSKLYVYDFIQQLALVEDDVLDAVGADVVELGHNFFRDDGYWRDWELQDGTPCKIPAFINVEKTKDGFAVYGDEGRMICIQKNGCLYFEQTYFPLKDRADDTFCNLPGHLNQIMWWRLGSPPAPAGFDAEGLRIRRAAAEDLRKSTDRAIYGIFGGSLVEFGQFSFGMENYYCELALNPSGMHRFLDRLMDVYLDNLTKYLNAVGEYIDVIGFSDDLGMQTGPQMSPAMYREFFKPRHQILWQSVKKQAPHVKTCLHCCGGVYPLIGDLIDAGLDAMNPVQFNCAGMELSKLKQEFGNDMVFWGGGCDTKTVLPNGTPEQISRHVKENVSILKPGGGFVFQQVHNIMANVPPENIVAMFRAVQST